MGLHRPFQRGLFVQNGNVATSGGALNLAKGQLAIVDIKSATAKGAKIVSDLAGASKEALYELRLGKHAVPNARGGQNAKSYSSIPFKVGNVEEVYVSAPKTMVQKFDDIIIGYDGINDSTAMTFEDGDETVLDIKLKGAPIGAINQEEYLFKIHFGKIEGQTDQEVVEAAVERAKKELLPGSVSILNYVDIVAVNSENTLAGTPYVFSELKLSDEGTSNDLANVQAQYLDYKVELTDRVGVVSTYTILHPASVTLADYQETVPSYIKGCADCIEGYDALTAGVVYSVMIEDDGADLTTTVDDVPGFVTGSVIKQGQNAGIGLYTVVVDNELTDAEIATFIAASAVKSTASFTLLGDVSAVCENTTVTSTEWNAKETCYASAEVYKIQLKDNDCGESRLAELQASYPDLVIVEGAPTGNAVVTVDLSGTSGTANVVIDGVNYLATFNTDLSTTESDFVTAHASAIATATGAVVTYAGGLITITDDALEFPSISVANVSGDLAGTVGASTLEVDPEVGGCQRVYSTSVITNIVCDECDDIFTDIFKSVAPNDFEFTSWVKLEPSFSDTAKMGIRITGKPFVLSPDEWLKDEVPFYETSVEIEVAGGYTEEFNFSTPDYDKNFAVKVLSKKEDRDHLGANLLWLEEESRVYFDGVIRHRNNNFAKAFLGEESVLDLRKQYVMYGVVIKDNGYAQSFGSSMDTAINYTIVVEVGKHEAVEDLVNALAAKAGIDGVQAFAKV